MTDDSEAVPESPEESATGEPLTADRVQSWKGFRLDDIGGATVGKVEGAYVDAETGTPEWLLARMGRFGHHCLVPARDAVAAAGHVWVPHGRDEIRKAPRQEPGAELEREAERRLLSHYGVGTGATGRAEELEQRAEGSVTARPA